LLDFHSSHSSNAAARDLETIIGDLPRNIESGCSAKARGAASIATLGREIMDEVSEAILGLEASDLPL